MAKSIIQDHRRLVWRRAVQWRTTQVIRGIRLIIAALGKSFARRERHDDRWVFYARVDEITLPVVSLVLPPSRALDELVVRPTIHIVVEGNRLSPSILCRLEAVIERYSHEPAS
jgi:hypothetical protein